MTNTNTTKPANNPKRQAWKATLEAEDELRYHSELSDRLVVFGLDLISQRVYAARMEEQALKERT